MQYLKLLISEACCREKCVLRFGKNIMFTMTFGFVCPFSLNQTSDIRFSPIKALKTIWHYAKTGENKKLKLTESL